MPCCLSDYEKDPAWRVVMAELPLEQELERHENEWEQHKGRWSRETKDESGISRITGSIFGLPFYMRRLIGNFGCRFVFMLTSVYFGVKGFLYTPFLSAALLPYFNRYLKVSASRYQAYQVVASTPWSIKAVFGAVSDLVPFFGYHKSAYIVLAAAMGTSAFVFLATVEFGQGAGWAAALLFMSANVELSIVDLLTEGKYAELMVRKPKTGGDLVTWVWLMYFSATLAGAYITGALPDSGKYREMFWFAVPMAAQVALPVLLGCFPEKRLPRGQRGIRTEIFQRNLPYFKLAAIMAAGSIGLLIVHLLSESYRVLLIYSLTTSIFLCIAAHVYMPKTLAKCNLYMFLASTFYLQIPGPLNYYYVADENCTPDGPQFDFTYYNSTSMVVSSICGCLGIMLFQTTMRNWKFRPMFWVTTVLRCAAAVVDIIIVKRWNIKMGIDDHVMYMLGNNIINSVVAMLDWMPAVVLTSKLCPKNMESTVYALLAGFQNFGQSIAMSLGLTLTEMLNIKAVSGGEEGDCNFDNLPILIGISHMILPLLVIPSTFWLIPDIRMTDPIVKDDEYIEMPKRRKNSSMTEARVGLLSAEETEA
eukprot:m.53017 g.53017  ORF g.53017 m.53017 type:complete len:590 (+) comp10836_c0_seq1:169-1938(+)